MGTLETVFWSECCIGGGGGGGGGRGKAGVLSELDTGGGDLARLREPTESVFDGLAGVADDA